MYNAGKDPLIHLALIIHLFLQLVYMDELPVLAQYFLAPQPYEIYSMGLSEGNVAKQLDFEYKRLTLQWLRTTEPAIPSGIAKEVIGLERYITQEMKKLLKQSALLCNERHCQIIIGSTNCPAMSLSRDARVDLASRACLLCFKGSDSGIEKLTDCATVRSINKFLIQIILRLV